MWDYGYMMLTRSSVKVSDMSLFTLPWD